MRYGAYLRGIPPSHRVGDYVHCTSRVVNIFLKRLLHLPNRTPQAFIPKESLIGHEPTHYPEARGAVSQFVKTKPDPEEGCQCIGR